jgi:hypothetical protein
MSLNKGFFILVISLFCVKGCSKNSSPYNQNGLIDNDMENVEINFTTIPKDNQLYARNHLSESEVLFEGIIIGVLDAIRLVTTNMVTNESIVVTQNVGSSFSFKQIISAGLHEYKFEIIGIRSEKEMLLKTINHVVCGDVYVVHGQSNAWAIDYDNAYIDLPNDAKWVRTIGSMHVYNKPGDSFHASNDNWYYATGSAPALRNSEFFGEGMIGVFGMRLGLDLVDHLKIPVAIINGSGGGGSIQHYLKSYDNDYDSPYGRLQYRINQADIDKNIRGFIWNQGEGNGGDTITEYKAALDQLYNQFNEDFSFEKFYIIQTPPGCPSHGTHTGVREAQRQVYIKHRPSINFMTRHGFTFGDSDYYLNDNCHYHAQGYIQLADWITNLVLYDIFDHSADYTVSNILSARKESTTTLILEFDKEVIFDEYLSINNGNYYLKDYFKIENSNIEITGIQHDASNTKNLVVKLSGPINSNDHITYLSEESYHGSNQAYIGPWILSASTKIGVPGFTLKID